MGTPREPGYTNIGQGVVSQLWGPEPCARRAPVALSMSAAGPGVAGALVAAAPGPTHGTAGVREAAEILAAR
jgi:hypothetical protein